MTLVSSRDALALVLESYYAALISAEFLAAESFAESIAAAAALASSTDAAYIVFYWDIDNIIEEISMVSHYKGKNIRTPDKEPKGRLDELTITDDDSVMFLNLLKNASKDVYKAIAAYGKGITGGYMFNNEDATLPIEYDVETIYDKSDLFYDDDQLYYTLADNTPAGTDPTDTDYFLAVGEHYNTYRKIIYVINYDSNMDVSMLDVLDKDLQDAILKYVLYEWFKLIQEYVMIPLSKEEYDDSITKIHVSAWYRKVNTRRRVSLL